MSEVVARSTNLAVGQERIEGRIYDRLVHRERQGVRWVSLSLWLARERSDTAHRLVWMEMDEETGGGALWWREGAEYEEVASGLWVPRQVREEHYALAEGQVQAWLYTRLWDLESFERNPRLSPSVFRLSDSATVDPETRASTRAFHGGPASQDPTAWTVREEANEMRRLKAGQAVVWYLCHSCCRQNAAIPPPQPYVTNPRLRECEARWGGFLAFATALPPWLLVPLHLHGDHAAGGTLAAALKERGFGGTFWSLRQRGEARLYDRGRVSSIEQTPSSQQASLFADPI